jgi:hypothetical protein
MTNDPIIQELRTIRKNTEEECRKKNQTYYDYMMEVQEKHSDRLASPKPDYIAIDRKQKNT